MDKFVLKNEQCYRLFFRKWKIAKDGVTKIYPKTAKAFPFEEKVDCSFCGNCQ